MHAAFFNAHAAGEDVAGVRDVERARSTLHDAAVDDDGLDGGVGQRLVHSNYGCGHVDDSVRAAEIECAVAGGRELGAGAGEQDLSSPLALIGDAAVAVVLQCQVAIQHEHAGGSGGETRAAAVAAANGHSAGGFCEAGEIELRAGAHGIHRDRRSILNLF
jgi:hypothetical protein